MRPSFLITIDTEGDNLWSRPRTITTHNAKFLPRFQALCESYRLKPTYLTTFEMAGCAFFQEFGQSVINCGTAEIGMHLHAWNSPPLIPLTPDDYSYLPYLIEYPDHVMRQKINYLTDLLEDTFGLTITSHRAGRWSFDEVYASILVQRGYQVDCSVTPHVSWKKDPGDPSQWGGTDYSNFPDKPYLVNLHDVSQPGESSLLEVPVTIVVGQNEILKKIRTGFGDGSLPHRALNRFFPAVTWLRPNGRNLKSMLRILKQASEEKRDYVQFMLHSSELMPGGSPTFRRDEDIESLYGDLEALFSSVSGMFQGATLTEYYREFRRRQALGSVCPIGCEEGHGAR